MPFDAPTKASSLSASRSGAPRVAPMLVVVQPQKRGVPRAPQLPARPATAGAFSRRLGGAAFECRGAAAAARRTEPASEGKVLYDYVCVPHTYVGVFG